MAEIKIEKKKGLGLTWLWVLLSILLVALLLWVFWPRKNVTQPVDSLVRSGSSEMGIEIVQQS